MLETLYTKRLILRPLELSDAERTQELFAQWEIVRYLNAAVPWPYPEAEAERYYRDLALPAMARGEEWHWTLRLKEDTAQHIAAIGLFRGETDNRGFWMGLPWQGCGLMTEAVIAVTDFWFDVLGFSVLRAPKAADNVASRRISEKTGMHIAEVVERDHVSGRFAAEIWEVTAEQWLRYRAAEHPPSP